MNQEEQRGIRHAFRRRFKRQSGIEPFEPFGNQD